MFTGSYSLSTIKLSLNQNSPVYIQGDDGTYGHAWVIDGYRTLYSSGVTSEYVCCNTGWSGTANGWYLSNVFDMKTGPVVPLSVARSVKEKYYRYNIKVCHHMTPSAPTVTIYDVPGVIPPEPGATPVTSIESEQYTGTVAWGKNVGVSSIKYAALAAGEKFAPGTKYRAKVTLTHKQGYTLFGVTANFFKVEGAQTSNAANLGVVTATFPKTPNTVTKTDLPGTLVPLAGAAPIISIQTAQYNASLTWSPAIPPNGTFVLGTQYTSTITLTAKPDYTLFGVTADSFKIEGAQTNNAANSGIISAVFPPALETVTKLLITGSYMPKPGGTPLTSVPPVGTSQYTGTVTWSPAVAPGGTFALGTQYTATFTLTPAQDYTMLGVPANFFKISGGVPATNAANSGIVTAVFPPAAYTITTSAITGMPYSVVAGTSPVLAITPTDQYTGSVTWSPAVAPGGTFVFGTQYTANISLTPTQDYTLQGVPSNFFKLYWWPIPVINAADSGLLTVEYPAAEKAVSESEVPGMLVPVPGGMPVRSIPETEEYTGTVTWCHGTYVAFQSNISYTAEIIIAPKPGYTVYSLPANFFSVYGASTSNSANSGKITAVFPPVP